MKQVPIASVVVLGLFGVACAAELWLKTRSAGHSAARRPVEQWENEGGALAPAPGASETSQVPR